MAGKKEEILCPRCAAEEAQKRGEVTTDETIRDVSSVEGIGFYACCEARGKEPLRNSPYFRRH